jgi:hypothetical protein
MQKRLGGIVANLLLSALVLAWGIVPPAIRHGHEGGEEANHSHEAVAHHEHDHDGHQHPGHEDSQPAGAVVSPGAFRGLVVHLHWSLFGVDFSVPVSQNEPPEDGSNNAEPALVRLVDSVPSPVLGNSSFAGDSSAAAAQAGLDSAVAPTSLLTTGKLTQSAPLCDRARHERSGVLLV